MLKKSFSSISLLLFFFLISCVNEAEQSTNDLGVLSPIKLGASDTTIVLLEDYFLDKKEVTGVNLPSGWTSAFSEQKDSLLIYSTDTRGKLFNLGFVTESGIKDVLCVGSVKAPVTITLEDKGYEKVQLKGEMTNWNLVDGYRKDVTWSFDFVLNPNQNLMFWFAKMQQSIPYFTHLFQ